MPADSASYFIDNEFLTDDVNRWTALARDRVGVRSLARATEGRFEESARYRDIFAPLGLGDELRAVLRIQGETWGLLCLHQAAGRSYTAQEANWLRRLARHLAAGMRLAVLHESADDVHNAAAPGIVMLSRRNRPTWSRRWKNCAATRSATVMRQRSCSTASRW